MKIRKNVEIPRNVGKRLGEANRAVVEFMESDDANIKFECGGKEEATRIYMQVKTYIKANELPLKAMKSGFDIYVIRKEVE